MRAADHRTIDLRPGKWDTWIADSWLFSTGTRSHPRFPACTSCPRRPGGSAFQCPRVSPPSRTPCWADIPQAAKPCSTEWRPYRPRTRSVCSVSALMLTVLRDAHCCYHRVVLLTKKLQDKLSSSRGQTLRLMFADVTCSTSGATWSWTLSAILCSPAARSELWRTKKTTHWQRYQRRRGAKARNGYAEHLHSILTFNSFINLLFF